MWLFYIVYSLVGLSLALTIIRTTYWQEGTFQYNTPACIALGIIFGAVWPITIVVLFIALLLESDFGKIATSKAKTIIVGKAR